MALSRCVWRIMSLWPRCGKRQWPPHIARYERLTPKNCRGILICHFSTNIYIPLINHKNSTGGAPHGDQEKRYLQAPPGRLRQVARRHGCLALQGLHTHPFVREIRLGARRSARCADRGAAGGASFTDMKALRGSKDIGEGMDTIIARIAEENDLFGVIDRGFSTTPRNSDAAPR